MLEYCLETYTPQSQQTLHHQQTIEFAPDSNIGGPLVKIHFQEIMQDPGHHLL